VSEFSHNTRPPREPKDLSHIRLAGADDEMGIFSLCSLMHAEIGLHPLAWPKVAAMVRLATQRTRGIIGVIGKPHDIKAAIFMVIEPVWYSDNFILMEYFNYVRPDARRSTYATDLLAYAKRCADDLGIDLTCGIVSTARTEAKCRLYRRAVPKVGEFFRYHPQAQMADDLVHLSRAPAANRVAAE
jgi:GNAT superfamily N-acetyltransferase